MTRTTDVVASSRPQKADAAPMRKGSVSALSRLMVLPVAFALAMALAMPMTAFAAEPGTSGYGSTPTTPTTPATPTTPTTPATPTTGTSPSKESSTPSKTTAPETTKSEPTTNTAPTATTAEKKATTLPFTGFDLRWTIGAGLLLTGMGFSLVTAQRRNRRNSSR
jgi:outer membrane biosynthesis protein TonB